MPAAARPRDPARTLAMLWGVDLPGARGPRPARSVDEVAAAATALADTDGALADLSMRRVAAALGMGTMSLYTYVQNKDDLVDLVVDRAYGEVWADEPPAGTTWRERLRDVAARNVAMFARHPWLLDLDLARPVLGPGETAKYDAELGALEGAGLDDVALDATVSLVVSLAASAARRAREARRVDESTDGTDDGWWEDNAPVLEAVSRASTFDRAARVGAAVADLPPVHDVAAAELAFGLERVLDGLEVMLAR